jgi:hypothetical protein
MNSKDVREANKKISDFNKEKREKAELKNPSRLFSTEKFKRRHDGYLSQLEKDW